MNTVLLFLVHILAGILVTFLFELTLKTNKKLRDRYYRRHEILLGYHVHHSTIGLLILILGILMYSLAMIGIGVGIIIMHTISSKRFVFIEKENF